MREHHTAWGVQERLYRLLNRLAAEVALGLTAEQDAYADLAAHAGSYYGRSMAGSTTWEFTQVLERILARQIDWVGDPEDPDSWAALLGREKQRGRMRLADQPKDRT